MPRRRGDREIAGACRGRYACRMSKPYSDAVARAIAAARQRSTASASAASETPDPARIVHQHFTVTGEATPLQAPAWSDYVGRFLQVPVSRAQIANGFHGTLDTYVLKDMIFLDSRTDPVVHARTVGGISTDVMRDYVFHVMVEGIIETATHVPRQAKAAQFVPGILALDLSQPMRMTRPTWARVLAFFLPRAMVEAAVPDAESLHGRVVTYTSPLACVFLDQLAELCRRLPALEGKESEELVRNCAQLIIAAFARNARLEGGARAAVRAAARGQVQRHVKANLHRSDLSPESILRAFPLPRPTLYRMFEPEGGLAAYIRNCRLREAANELVDSPQLPIKDIADHFGFGSASGFTHAFRRHYGRAPLEFRALGRDMIRD
jgi:AraC-like DNA-binding protein